MSKCFSSKDFFSFCRIVAYDKKRKRVAFMINEKDVLMHEVLINRYNLGYLARKRDLAHKLDELGYFNDETGQATEATQTYFDSLYEERKESILKEVNSVWRENQEVTYNQLSERLSFPANTFYLHHFLLKLNKEDRVRYHEFSDFDKIVKVKPLKN